MSSCRPSTTGCVAPSSPRCRQEPRGVLRDLGPHLRNSDQGRRPVSRDRHRRSELPHATSRSPIALLRTFCTQFAYPFRSTAARPSVVRRRRPARAPVLFLVTPPAEPRTTIAVVPRESYSVTPKMLDTLLAHTPSPRRVVIVDGNSPRRIRRHLERVASASDITLVHRGAAITANEARNQAMRHVTTEYVCFLDNDTFVDDGWLADLERSRTRPERGWSRRRCSGVEAIGGRSTTRAGRATLRMTRALAASRSTTRTCIALRAPWPSSRGHRPNTWRRTASSPAWTCRSASGRSTKRSSRARPFDARPAGQRPGWRDLARAVRRRAVSVAEAQHPVRLPLLSAAVERRMGRPVVPPVQRDVAADRSGDRRRLPRGAPRTPPRAASRLWHRHPGAIQDG